MQINAALERGIDSMKVLTEIIQSLRIVDLPGNWPGILKSGAILGDIKREVAITVFNPVQGVNQPPPTRV